MRRAMAKTGTGCRRPCCIGKLLQLAALGEILRTHRPGRDVLTPRSTSLTWQDSRSGRDCVSLQCLPPGPSVVGCSQARRKKSRTTRRTSVHKLLTRTHSDPRPHRSGVGRDLHSVRPLGEQMCLQSQSHPPLGLMKALLKGSGNKGIGRSIVWG